jgi:dCTP deaminase
MSVLGRSELLDRLKRLNLEDRLVVSPLLNIEKQLGPASIDVRLGTSILLHRKSYLTSIDVADADKIMEIENVIYEKLEIGFFNKFTLHPGELILGATFEYISLPQDLFATIISRSSWGRLGLVIATATSIQPGYKGCLTLELANVGDNPLTLYPGLSIGQLIVFNCESDAPKEEREHTYSSLGRYKCPTKPEFPKFNREFERQEQTFWSGVCAP